MQAVSPSLQISSELFKAQVQLNSLRRERGASTASSGKIRSRVSPLPSSIVNALPAHLGWHIHPSTQPKWIKDSTPLYQLASNAPASGSFPTLPDNLRVPADIGTALLREGKVTVGRLWLLLRGLDNNGQGWVVGAAAKAAFCDPQARFHLCGWRQFRKLLSKGHGFFWRYEQGRIWLTSMAKVAVKLKIKQLRGGIVRLPTTSLTQSIGKTRATMYALFHGSRQLSMKSGKFPANPISRATVTALCGVSRPTQRAYEAQAGIQRQTNYCVVPAASAGQMKDLLFKKGNAIRQCRQQINNRYSIIWQLPNSYQSPIFSIQKSRRFYRLKKELAVLYAQGKTGNVNCNRDEQPIQKGRRLYQGVGQPIQGIFWRDYADGNRFGTIWRAF